MQIVLLNLLIGTLIITQNTQTFSMSKNNIKDKTTTSHALSPLSQTILSDQTNSTLPLVFKESTNSLKIKETNSINSFFQAIRSGDQDLVIQYLDDGMDPNTRATNDFHYGMTALMVAVGERRIGITKILLQAGADPNISIQNKKIEGITALMISSFKGPLETVCELLDAGVDINAQTSGIITGSTALTAAIGAKKINIIKKLIERGADTSIKTSRNKIKGITPLMIAAQSGNTSILKTLLDISNIDINAKDSENKNALIYAYISGNVENVKLLLDSGATNDLSSIEIQKILENYLTNKESS